MKKAKKQRFDSFCRVLLIQRLLCSVYIVKQMKSLAEWADGSVYDTKSRIVYDK